MTTTNSYYVICNKTSQRYISTNPSWNPYNEESVPNEGMAVANVREGADNALADYNEYLERTINDPYDYRSVYQDMLVLHLKEAELIVVKVTETHDMKIEICEND